MAGDEEMAGEEEYNEEDYNEEEEEDYNEEDYNEEDYNEDEDEHKEEEFDEENEGDQEDRINIDETMDDAQVESSKPGIKLLFFLMTKKLYHFDFCPKISYLLNYTLP